jgi:hypothetical protein
MMVIALLVLVASPSLAQAWGGPAAQGAAAAPQEDEKALVRKGSESFLHQDYEAARVALLHAYQLNPKPDTILKLGIAELQSAHPVEATQHLREYLTHSEEPPAKLELVRTKWLPRAEASTARLDIFAPPGAEILLDGVLQERAAFSTIDEFKTSKPSVSIVIAAGEHDVSARQGTTLESRHVVARGGELVELHFQRVPDAPPPAPTVIAAGAAADAHEEPSSGNSSTSRPRRITTIGLGSVAVVATGIAVGFSIAYEENVSNANALRRQIGNGGCRPPSPAMQCADLGSVDKAEQRNGSLANGFYVAGGATAALAVASWFLWPKARSSGNGLRAVPLIGERSPGMALSGAW